MPEPLIVKICGITRFEDGAAALDAGADWLGFIRWANSPRFRPIEECATLVEKLRVHALDRGRTFQSVGVYVDAPVSEIERESALAHFDRVQLHGSESPGQIAELQSRIAVPIMKVIKIRDAASISEADKFPGLDLLTDTHDPALPGGTGRAYNPALLKDLVARRRVVVAGGLTAENVGDVVRFLHPFGVDVSSGVESSPAIKDHDKIRHFIQSARG